MSTPNRLVELAPDAQALTDVVHASRGTDLVDAQETLRIFADSQAQKVCLYAAPR